ncbi:MAG: hypothetical protein IKH45_02730 [Neisseriaceae bacterium]|nr:hypothetical protein [Neisseriaceae bacterium]
MNIIHKTTLRLFFRLPESIFALPFQAIRTIMSSPRTGSAFRLPEKYSNHKNLQ